MARLVFFISDSAGQAIPAGLHVRMDLTTGVREAKLLDEDETTQEEQSQDEKLDQSEEVKQADCEEGLDQEVSDTFKYWKEGDKEGIVHAKEKYFTHEELKKAMKHFRANKDDVEDEAVSLMLQFHAARVYFLLTFKDVNTLKVLPV